MTIRHALNHAGLLKAELVLHSSCTWTTSTIARLVFEVAWFSDNGHWFFWCLPSWRLHMLRRGNSDLGFSRSCLETLDHFATANENQVTPGKHPASIPLTKTYIISVIGDISSDSKCNEIWRKVLAQNLELIMYGLYHINNTIFLNCLNICFLFINQCLFLTIVGLTVT